MKLQKLYNFMSGISLFYLLFLLGKERIEKDEYKRIANARSDLLKRSFKNFNDLAEVTEMWRNKYLDLRKEMEK